MSNAGRCSSAISDEFEPGQAAARVAEQYLGGPVRRAHVAVVRGHEHRVAHAVEQDAEVVAGNRRARERLAHPLECVLDVGDLSYAAARDGRIVVAVADAFGAAHDAAHRRVDARNQERCDDAREHREREPGADEQRYPQSVREAAIGQVDHRDDAGGEHHAHQQDRQHVAMSELQAAHGGPASCVAACVRWCRYAEVPTPPVMIVRSGATGDRKPYTTI